MINGCLWNDRKTNRSRRMGFIAVGCFLLMAVCIACASLTYGRYLQSKNDNYSAQVAVIRTQVTPLDSTTITLNNLGTLTVETGFFQVKRVDESGATEVSFSYSIFLKVPKDFPDYLSVELIEGNKPGISGVLNEKDGTITFDGTYKFSVSDTSTLKKFKFKFTVKDASAVPEDGIKLEGIQIVVHSEQIQEGA